ncbi:substrate-binding periplasmic protein [Dialister sp. UBA1703]|uniref:substrate-binding periplasmic protein n=1 Tax=Dialister sp. UBA1703 TaxID=1946415 RepID=UPI0025C69959|nr:ABC transporter substrate-binding protein [Dialister sp. UBA1703]
MNRWMKAGAAVLVLGVLGTMAGCGGKQAASSAPAKPAAASSAKKELKVACVATYPPFVYKDKDGKIVGFDVDITGAVAKELGAKVVYESMPFNEMVPTLTSNKADIAVAAVDMTQDRADKVDFSNIYYSKENVSILARKEDNEIRGPEDLKGKKVAVEKGTVYVGTAKQYGAEVKEYDYHDQLIKAVEDNEADALILDKPVARFYLAHGASEKLKPAGIISGSGGFVMMVSKKDEGLREKVNEALDKLMKNGEYDKIYDKWFADENFSKEPDVKS